ncbi:hypothetical protein OQA88_2051 [Cercophora sp. LCS_1]
MDPIAPLTSSKAQLGLPGNATDLERRLQSIWEDTCLKPSIDCEQDNDESESESSVEIESVSSQEADRTDIIVNCPLWRDLPGGLLESLLRSAKDSHQHFERLDESLSDLLLFQVPHDVGAQLEPTPVSAAADILRRLPAFSSPLPDNMMCGIDGKQDHPLVNYLLSENPENARGAPWARYKVTTLFDTNTLRLALLVALLDQTTHPLASQTIQGYVNLLSRLFDSMSTHCTSEDSNGPWSRHACHVAQAFLWTARQRALLLFSHYVFGTRLRREINSGWFQSLPQPDVDIDPDLDFSALGSIASTGSPDAETAPACGYLCRYSFELLQASALSATQDYRTLFARFNEQFCENEPRCRREASDGTWQQCRGKSWESCGRFFGLEIPDQSAHDTALCTKPCRRLRWDRLSYLAVEGPRSLDYNSTPPGGPLRYCAASTQTLAISHVWSHGQGGDAEQGFNECLHKRYSGIARDLGCGSYWIDAACIPLDRELRSAAIRTINPIFKNSKVTLICDKDVAEVDVGDLTSIRQLEILVSVLLLSDWNVRGWTMLEAIRGNAAVHILCKGNRPVPLRDILAGLYRGGSIDLCALLIGSPQLMPPRGAKFRTPSIETAGVMLARRFASRRGDDIIIWSLLCKDGNDNTPAHQSPLALWKSKVNTWVKTGFLISSCDRIPNAPRGFGWAPATPFLLGPHVAPRPAGTPLYWSYDGSGTNAARIMQVRGKTFLRGSWLVHVYDAGKNNDAVDAWSCWERAAQLVSEGYRRVLFLRPLFVESIESGWASDLSAAFTAARSPGEDQAEAAAVCATREDHAQYVDPADPDEYTGEYELEPEGWEWKGVYPCPEGGMAELRFQTRYIRVV